MDVQHPPNRMTENREDKNGRKMSKKHRKAILKAEER